MNQCAQNPASCLPDVPDPDLCIQNPQSCLPAPPDPDPCLANPASCVPEPAQVGPCLNDPGGCVPDPSDPGGGDPSGEEDRGGTAAPVRGSKPSGGPGGGSTSRPARPASGVSSAAGVAGGVKPVADLESFTQPESGGVLGALGSGVAEATRRFAFPIGIVALVGAFLLVQGRVDRKDPKLAAAPIDSRDDLVIYR